MTTQQLFFPAGISFAGTYLANVGDQTVDQKLDELSMEPAGDFAPNYTGHKKKASEFSVESFDLVKALDLMTSEAMCGDQSAGNVDLYYRKAKKAAFAYPTGGSNHLVYRLQQNSMVWWEQIDSKQDDELKISLKLEAWYNTTNAILLALPNQTLPSPGTIVAPFTLGPIVLNGTTLLGLKSLSWKNNLEVIKEYDGGEAVPSALFCRRAKPVISFETSDPQQIHSLINIDGEAVNSLTVFFRRRRPNKLNYDDADLQHAKLEADNAGCGTARWMTVSGDPAKVKVEIALNRVGTDPLFEYTKDCAIT